MRFKQFVLIFFFAISVFGQTKTFVGFRAGAGASTAYMRHSIIPVIFDVSWLPGTSYGLQVTHFPEKFKTSFNAAIQFGVNVTQKGWIQQFSDLGLPNHKTRITYLELPVDAIMYVGNKNKYFVSAGFFVEYALSDKVDPIPVGAVENAEYPRLYDIGQSNFYRYDIQNDLRLNYGPRGSAGIFRETNIGVFRLEGYFTFSIRSVFDFEPIESGVPDLSLNYGAGVTLGYMFSLGKLSLTD